MLGPIETSNSDANHAVLHAQNHRWGLERILSFYSCAKHAVMCAQSTDEDWDPYRLVSLVLKVLFCMHKSTDEGWNP